MFESLFNVILVTQVCSLLENYGVLVMILIDCYQ